MSRRRGEFEHRTTIFEGAFRAWSHLGGLDPLELETKSSPDLDPLTNPIVGDSRLTHKHLQSNADGSTRREYPYEPLPRSGLCHPFVQAILSPWLGPDADNEAIQLGLTTLRTWWQHRRKGESGSAIAALGTEKMKGVVEGYTRHFFTLAHCVVFNDKAQPPRGLHGKMKELEKMRSKKRHKAAAGGMAVVGGQEISGGSTGPLTLSGQVSAIRADLTDPNLTPLEKLHVAQRRQLESTGGITSSVAFSSSGSSSNNNNSMLPSSALLSSMMTGKCVPGKIDLPGVVDAVNRHATQLAHRGTAFPSEVGSGIDGNMMQGQEMYQQQQQQSYGDPNTTPVVFVSSNGDIQIAMKVDGITCAHCVKIVETVLRGCNGNKSPISGLLDAAADGDLNSVLLKIDEAASAKRIAFEAARNLSMVGYTAEPMSMSIIGSGSDPGSHSDLGALATAFEVVATTEATDVFDWRIPCTCPDNGVLRGDCARHSQMNTRIFDAFTAREQQVMDYMAGCGMKYGMDCTCGPNCRCKNCPIHDNNAQAMGPPVLKYNSSISSTNSLGLNSPSDFADVQVDQPMQFSSFGMGPPGTAHLPLAPSNMNPFSLNDQQNPFAQHGREHQQHRPSTSRAQRNHSSMSYGNRGSLRGMSITSETTFGRAMSGLSALSIDWENLDDFDVEVDHSAHINGNPPAGQGNPGGGGGPRRASATRRSNLSTGSQDGTGGAHVSFKVQ